MMASAHEHGHLRSPRPWRFAAALFPLTAAITTAYGQSSDGSAGGRTLSIVPSVTVRETFTDNRDLSEQKRADAYTDGTVALRASSTGGRVRGFFDYALTGTAYAREGGLSDFRNALAAAGTAELIERRAFLDMRASISREVISPFGTLSSSDSTARNRNTAEMRTWSISPYILGTLASGNVDYSARLFHQATSGEVSSGASGSDAASVSVSRANRSLLGWSIDGSLQRTDYRATRSIDDHRLDGTLLLQPMLDLQLGVSAGLESTNLISVERENHATRGVSLRWTPSPRTFLSANVNERFFGKSHQIIFNHRTARTAWSFTDTRDLSTSDPGSTRYTTQYQYARQLFEAAFPGVDQASLQRFLATQFGLTPTSQGKFLPFVTSGATLQRRQSASFSWNWPRTVFSISYNRSETQSLGNTDFLFGSLGSIVSSSLIRQRGVSLNASHKLTPVTSLSANFNWQRTLGDTSALSATLRAFSLDWTTSLDAKRQAGIGFRRDEYAGIAAPYDANSVYASYRQQF
jgi:uncharacterized protein (PEP-CTERM system associated)